MSTGPVDVGLPNSLADRDRKISAELINLLPRTLFASTVEISRRASVASQRLDGQDAILGVQILHRTRWSRNGLKKSGRRVVLVSKIEIAFKICLTLLGDRVPWPGRICDFNQTGVFQLWKASFDCRVRDVVAFEIQIDFQPPLVQGSPGFSEILQDNVVPPSHPWSAVTSGHIRKPESSRIICRDLSLCEQISSILDQYTGQVLYPLTKKLVTGTDATLLGGVDTGENRRVRRRVDPARASRRPQRGLPTHVNTDAPGAKIPGTVRRIARRPPARQRRAVVVDEGPRRPRARFDSPAAP